MGRGGANQVDEERFSRTCPYLSGCNGNCGARRRAWTRDFVVVRASITPRPSPDPFAVHRDRPSGGFFEPAPTAAVLREGLPPGQNARLPGGIEKEIEGVTLDLCALQPPAIPIAPLQTNRSARRSWCRRSSAPTPCISSTPGRSHVRRAASFAAARRCAGLLQGNSDRHRGSGVLAFYSTFAFARVKASGGFGRVAT